MAFTNISNIVNAAPLDMNITSYNSSTQAITDMMTSPITQGVGNYWYNISIFVIWCFLIWFFFRNENRIALDLTRSVFISSAWVFFISVAVLLSGWINTIMPIIWYGTVWFITFIGILKLKPKNL